MAEDKLILFGLRPEEYEHPLDRKALEALQGTPGLERFMRWINENFTELSYTIAYTGSCVEVTPRMFPKLYMILEDVCNTIHIKPMPALYIEQNPMINAFTVGSEKPIVVLNTATVELLTENELQYIIGHEVGHIKSGHCLYRMMAWKLFPLFIQFLSSLTAGYGGLAIEPIYLALQYWSRMSEYTADRAGLLACQDVDAVTTACMKMGGVPKIYYDNLDSQAFMEQARRFEEFDQSKWKKFMKLLAIMDSTHPWTVYRAKEVDKWIQNEAYANLLQKRGAKMDYVPCPSCGNRLLDTANFCNRCGSPMAGEKFLSQENLEK